VDTDTTNLTVTVGISTNNGVEWFVPTSSNLTGAVGENNVAPGNNRTIIWDGGRELPPQLFPLVKAKITADDTPPKVYMLIDLAGGTSASSYPVSYLSEVPTGGWTTTYKTTIMVLRKIPKGTYTMGVRYADVPGGYDDLCDVTLTKDFYIGVFEVTQKQWELVMGNKPSYFNNVTYYASRPVEQVSYYDIRENPANSDDPAVDWPANNSVKWTSFMGKLRAKTGLSSFDLPTESQWEYACRAGTTTALNTGYNLTNITNDAHMTLAGRYRYNGGYINGTTVPPQNCTTVNGTAKVGSYLPNDWGLYDMHGNVVEWCLDYEYGDYSVPVTDPKGASSGQFRLKRGGSWMPFAYHCRSAYQDYAYPNARNSEIGFRAARTMP
jgi:formylglycine-generating enzyme required for sulfatase activity